MTREQRRVCCAARLESDSQLSLGIILPDEGMSRRQIMSDGGILCIARTADYLEGITQRFGT